jgi:acetyl coenzyme A synthetase (ADP forming)-like protein
MLIEGHDTGTLVVRDGSRLKLSRALPEDAQQIQAFLDRLPKADRCEVTRSLRLEPSELPQFLDRLAQLGHGAAFVVSRENEVVAFGAFRVLESIRDSGSISIAVAPELRKMGIASLLLERLAVLAAGRGLGRLVGISQADNQPLIELFRSAGFEPDVRTMGDSASFLISTRPDTGDEAVRRGLSARTFTAASLRPLFFPRSIAVVGASRNPDSVGYRLLESLVKHCFNGPIFPVNPKANHVFSIRAYPSLEAIGETVDLAILVVPARIIPRAVKECAKVGVRALIVISAGFAEIGGEGRARQNELLELVRSRGMRMVGPNCLGVVHPHPDVHLNASFSRIAPAHGSVALCSQSGALGVAIIALTRRLGLGLSSFVSVGNKADISGNDLLEYWEEDSTTRVILFYLESFGNPRRFARIARRIGRSKPIVMVKAGRTAAGSRAASSHTAALTAADTTVDALFSQTGTIRADTLEEMFDIARALTDQPLPRDRRVAVVTNAGGPAILCTDALEASGLRVEPLSDATQKLLEGLLPAEASTANPVDMIASAGPETYRKVVEIVLAAEEIDAMVVIYTPVGMFDTNEVGQAVSDAVEAARLHGGAGKPVMASIVGDEISTFVLEAEGGERIPVYPFPEAIGRFLGKVAQYSEWRTADPGLFPEFADQQLDQARDICRKALAERGPGWLSVDEARHVLEAAGMMVGAGGVAATSEQAVEIADAVGYPVAVKLASLEIVHKTEIGGVVLDLQSADQVRDAFMGIRDRLEAEGSVNAMQGVLVQPMLAGASEVMIGVNDDPGFGPVIAFGLGGVHVEILRDVAFRVSPLTDLDARSMIREVRGFVLLEGYRGHPPADVDALEEALLRISRLVEAVPEIGEIDLNPIFALAPGDGYRIIDARIMLQESSRK